MADQKLIGVKAIALDMDGTLLRPDKTISPRTLAALTACMEKGIHVMLATGRGPESVEPYRARIGATGPQLYYNGAEVLDMPSRKFIHGKLLKVEAARFLAELSRKTGCYFQGYFPSNALAGASFAVKDPAKEALLADRLGEESDYYRKTSGLQPQAGDLLEALSLPEARGIIKGMFIVDESRHAELREAIAERLGDEVSVVRSSPLYLEILAAGVSKGDGLIHALEYLGLDAAGALAFGDEENDLPMLEAAGFSAAPANSSQNALDAADFHIGSNADDGVAAFLEERVL
jgi:Cof subfamily protein (haloacid dehalogenase superfamily)